MKRTTKTVILERATLDVRKHLQWRRHSAPTAISSCGGAAAALLIALGPWNSADAQDEGGGNKGIGGPNDPVNRLDEIQKNRRGGDFIFPSQPLDNMQRGIDSFQSDLYDSTGLNLGLAVTSGFQGATGTLSGTDNTGVASTALLVGKWDLINRGTPTQGELVFGVEGRWDYGTTGPEAIGFGSIGSGIGTFDTFDRYVPAFLMRQIFWRQGSPEAGWSYRIGKITPDGMLAASNYFDSTTAFLPTGSTGANAIAFPDSGLGAAAVWYPNERVRVMGLISDANADRLNLGNPGAGDFFKAVELQAQIAPPRTPEAGYSTFTLWHTDGTDDGMPLNGSSGESGWGFFIKHEQELTNDGKNIGILRYGKSFDDSALAYEQQASIHYVRKDPFGLSTDLLGIGCNWIDPASSSARDEYDIEVFHRMPLFRTVDLSFAYQAIINPAFNTEEDLAHVFSLRIRKTF